MMINGVTVVAEDDITEEEITAIVSEELQLWKQKGKELGKVTLSLDGEEIVVKAVERSPIRRIRRITGYLSTEDRFNAAKQAELTDRVVHF